MRSANQLDARVGVGGLVKVPPLADRDPVCALGVPVGADQRGRLALGPGDRGHQAFVLVRPHPPAEGGRVEGAVPDQGAAHVQGDHRQAVPEVPAPVTAQRTRDRLDSVPPHQPHMVAMPAERERGVPGAAGAGHLAVHTRVAREPAQPLRGRIGVRSQDLLDGQHIGAESHGSPR